MPLDDINTTFAKLACMIDDKDAAKSPKEFAAAVAGLALARIVVTDLRRLADAQESMAHSVKAIARLRGKFD
jgi:hypothetical protein